MEPTRTRPGRATDRHARDTALELAFDALGVGVGIAAEAGRLVEVNEALLQVLGTTRQQALGATLAELMGLFEPAVPAARGAATELGFVRSDGRRTWVRVTVTEVRARDDRTLLTVSAVEDVTHQRAQEEALRDRALLDPVTGLPNRYLLEDRLDHALAQRARGGPEVAVLFVDLDGFKSVNDRAGHRAGDLVLQEAGRRISSCARSVDTVARWAGDEFVVLCAGVDDELDAALVATRITAACEEPFGADGRLFSLSASVGVATTSRPATVDAAALLDRADRAMYADKTTRRRAVEAGGP